MLSVRILFNKRGKYQIYLHKNGAVCGSFYCLQILIFFCCIEAGTCLEGVQVVDDAVYLCQSLLGLPQTDKHRTNLSLSTQGLHFIALLPIGIRQLSTI